MGHVFVVRGDIANCQADALVFSTSTEMKGDGFLKSSFDRWHGFATWYASLSKHGEIGETDWLPPHDSKPGTPGIVLVRSVGRTNPSEPGERIIMVLQRALQRARDELAVSRPENRWLVLVPALLTGKGGGSEVRREVAEKAIQTAEEFIRGTPQMDVAFVMFTPASYALYRAARRLKAPLPQEFGAPSALQSATRDGELVVFVGAGASMGAGMPGWTELINQMAKNAGIATSKKLPYKEKLAIAQRYRATWKEQGLPDVASVVNTVFGQPPAPTLTHYLLAQLETRFLVTTNYDRLLENTLESVRRPFNRVTSAYHVPATSLRGVTQVLKLHGDAAPDTEQLRHDEHDGYRAIVLSTEDYRRFHNQRSAFDLLLTGLMLNHTFLFVGYSVSDENVRRMWHRMLEAINQQPDELTRNRPAFGLEFRNVGEPVSGLHWISDPGRDGTQEDSIRAQCVILDALADNIEDPAQILAPDHPTRETALAEVGEPLVEMVKRLAAGLRSSKELPVDQARAAERLVEVAYELGWRPKHTQGEGDLWIALADAVKRGPEQDAYLDMAIVHAPSMAKAEELRARRLKL